MWTIYQDSPAYGCDDHPSFRWYAYRAEANGHISKSVGPFDLRREVFEATQATRAERLSCIAHGDADREDTQAAKRLLSKASAQ